MKRIPMTTDQLKAAPTPNVFAAMVHSGLYKKQESKGTFEFFGIKTKLGIIPVGFNWTRNPEA